MIKSDTLPDILPITNEDIYGAFQAHGIVPTAACLQHLKKAASMSPGAFASLKNDGTTWGPVIDLTVLFLTCILMGGESSAACKDACEELNSCFPG